ncbi:MAG: hypothetical protein WCO60_10270 [Verrucomicrobiota bacterium]
MNITSVAGASAAVMPTEGVGAAQGFSLGGSKTQPDEVARQFEAILVRQMLSESMKPLLENGKSGQVYGYFLTDALADGITKGGGLGLRSILEAQLRLREHALEGGKPDVNSSWL